MQTALPLLELRLSPHVVQVLTPLCVALPLPEAEALRQAVSDYCVIIRSALAYNEFLDVATAEHIRDTLGCLFDAYDTLPAEQQALVVGAARYFVQTNDAEPDTVSILGFDDDVVVLNVVVEMLGREDLKLTL